jgi:leucine-rich repeat protein SHOC2
MNAKTAELARIIETMPPNTTVLDLRGYGLETLPDNIGTLTSLTKLNLNGNRLTSLPDSIGNLTNLAELYLNGHKLTALPESIGKLTNLTRLALNGDRLESLPDSITNLTKLTELHLNSNRFDRIPVTLFNLANLQEINLDGNPLADLSILKNIPNLKISRSHIPSKLKLVKSNDTIKIVIGNRYIDKILLDLASFTNLVSLSLNGYGIDILDNRDTHLSLQPEAIEKILTDISKLPNIGSLSWNVNLFPYFSIIQSIASLNDINFFGIHLDRYRLHHLSSISYLYLQANIWTDLSILHNLPGLEYVYLYFKYKNRSISLKLSQRYWTKVSNWKSEWLLDEKDREVRKFIVEEVGFCIDSLISYMASTRLPIANLSNLNLETLPNCISDSVNLYNLDLSNNKLTALPEGIFDLANLQELNLSDNFLSELPDGIGRFKKIVKLELFNNKLVNISDEIGKLSNINLLNLSSNNIVSIPYTIDGLIKLKKLSINQNKLKILPNSIGHLKYIETLDLGNNQLTSLPDRIGNLKKLSSIVLSNNPLKDISILNNIVSLKQVIFAGVSLPRRYWTNFSEWNPQWLLDETNTEIRRMLVEQIGYEKICIVFKAVEVDIWREYRLLKINKFQPSHRNIWGSIVREPIALLKMTCPSTGHIHMLRVPPDMTSAEAAITWINHGVHPDRFAIQT